MARTIFCGIDLGTTNTKAVLIGRDGNLVETENISAPQKKADADITDWYKCFCDILDRLAAKGYFSDSNIVCSITAQGGSFVLLDEKFAPASRVYSWTENASNDAVQSLINSIGSLPYYHLTGWEPDSWLMACKLKDLVSKKQFPENARYISTVPEFIFSQLLGEFVTDITNAQITGLCDFQNARWDEKILNWVGVDNTFLPHITDSLSIIFDKVQTKWGKISFATSSHDQYAAMQTAGLENDKDVMLGTGTAWVINGRNSKPLFDDKNFISHPGKDLFENCFGNIIITGTIVGHIGKGLDDLLEQCDIDKLSLAQIEKSFGQEHLPDEAIDIDFLKGTALSGYESPLAVRRYMEGTASLIAFLLEQFQPEENSSRVIMSGGAVAGGFWPQVIADLCDTTVDTIIFPEFTAYGAALYAKSAFESERCDSRLLEIAETRKYEPMYANQYQHWYRQYQKPMFKET